MKLVNVWADVRLDAESRSCGPPMYGGGADQMPTLSSILGAAPPPQPPLNGFTMSSWRPGIPDARFKLLQLSAIGCSIIKIRFIE